MNAILVSMCGSKRRDTRCYCCGASYCVVLFVVFTVAGCSERGVTEDQHEIVELEAGGRVSVSIAAEQAVLPWKQIGPAPQISVDDLVGPIAFSPDGRELAAIRSDLGDSLEIVRWSTQTGAELGRFRVRGAPGGGILYSSDGSEVRTYLGAWRLRENSWAPWKVEGKLILAVTPDPRQPTAICVPWPVAATFTDESIRSPFIENDCEVDAPIDKIEIVDVATGNVVTNFGIPLNVANTTPLRASIAVDGRRCLVRSSDGFWICDSQNGKVLRQFTGNERFKYAKSELSPDGAAIAIAEGRGLVVMDVLSGEKRCEVKLPEDERIDGEFSFSADGATVAARIAVFLNGEHKHGVVLWNVATGDEIRRVYGAHDTMAFSADHRLAAAAFEESGGLKLWDVASWKELPLGSAPVREITGLTFVSGDRQVAYWTKTGHFSLFDIKTEAQLGQHEIAGTPRWFSRDGWLMAEVQGNRLRLRETATGRQLLARDVEVEWSRYDNASAWLDIQLDRGKALVSRGLGKLGIMDLASGKLADLAREPQTEFDSIESASLSPDGSTVAVVGDHISDYPARVIEIWDTATGKLQNQLEVMPKPRRRIGMAPDGRTPILAATSEIPDRYTDVRFLGDGRTLIASREIGLDDLWHVTTRRVIRVLSGDYRRRGVEIVTADAKYGVDVYDSNEFVIQDLLVGGPCFRLKMPERDRRDSPNGEPKDHRAPGYYGPQAFSPDARYVAFSSYSAGRPIAIHWLIPKRVVEVANKPIDDNEFVRLWDELASADAEIAYAALWRCALSGDAVVNRLSSKHARPKPDAAGVTEIKRLVGELANSRHQVRAEATDSLEKLGVSALGLLSAELEAASDPEVRIRLTEIISAVEATQATPSAELLRRWRVVQILERVGSAKAKAVLAELTEGSTRCWEVADARAALERLDTADN